MASTKLSTIQTPLTDELLKNFSTLKEAIKRKQVDRSVVAKLLPNVEDLETETDDAIAQLLRSRATIAADIAAAGNDQAKAQMFLLLEEQDTMLKRALSVYQMLGY